MDVLDSQLAVCRRLGVEPVPADPSLKVGASIDIHAATQPVKAVRHLPVGDTTGWYIWRGEIEPATQRDDFFVSLHAAHLDESCPEIVPYLALPPGYGVIVAPGYEDVWFDESYLVA